MRLGSVAKYFLKICPPPFQVFRTELPVEGVKVLSGVGFISDPRTDKQTDAKMMPDGRPVKMTWK